MKISLVREGFRILEDVYTKISLTLICNVRKMTRKCHACEGVIRPAKATAA